LTPSTRILLVLASLGALTALVLLALIPVGGPLAAFSPPLYALVVAVNSVLPFLARRMLGFPFAATFVSFFAGLLTGAFSSIGFLVLVPLVAGSLTFDLVVSLLNRIRRDRRPGEWRWAVAAAASGVVLFLVSLPVFSPGDLIPSILVVTLVARVAGQLAASLLSRVLAARLARAGISA